MRIFVTGTGRCGTTTFSKACSHIDNFTSGHETKRRGCPQSEIIDFPDNHIEVDAHLFWHMPKLINKYPDAYWVHLIRSREECVLSLTKTSGIKDWMRLAYVGATDLRQACEDYYDNVNSMISKNLLRTGGNYRGMHLEKLPLEWSDFWDWIGATGNYQESIDELSIKHNARK